MSASLVDTMTSPSLSPSPSTESSTTTTTSSSVSEEANTLSSISNGSTESIQLVAKWNGKEYLVVLREDETISDLKHKLQDLTNVQVKRQKLVGISKKQPPDTAIIKTLGLKRSHHFFLMGTLEENIPTEIPKDVGVVLSDWDYDYFPTVEEVARNETNRLRLNETIAKTSITLINPISPEKKLLVLDLDHTILDFSKYEEEDLAGDLAQTFKRPHCDEFLAQIFPYYNLGVWSQTHWRWLEVKLTELGLLTHPEFKISFVLDKSSMFSIILNQEELKKGERAKREHEVKALEIIWSKLPQFCSKNTLHVDDLARNFALNPKCGIKISPFKRNSSRADTALLRLAQYLIKIAHEDFSLLDHSQWEESTE